MRISELVLHSESDRLSLLQNRKRTDYRNAAFMAGATVKNSTSQEPQGCLQVSAMQKTANSHKNLAANQKRISELQGLIQSVYENKYLGKITETTCGVLLGKCETELKALQEE